WYRVPVVAGRVSHEISRGGTDMCDQDHFEDDRQEFELLGQVTRRQFGVLVGAGIALMLPQVANAVAVTDGDVTITTPDGSCDAYFVHPSSGTAPGVLIWPDIFGLRPAMRNMGKRLAESGYSVLVVNPFYRVKKAPTAANGAATASQDLMPLARALNETTQMTDAKAFVGWLDQQASVAKDRKMATQGCCMGGPIAFRTSAAVPARVGAVASFHGGGLVTDQPNSPHLQASKTSAQFLFAAIAIRNCALVFDACRCGLFGWSVTRPPPWNDATAPTRAGTAADVRKAIGPPMQ